MDDQLQRHDMRHKKIKIEQLIASSPKQLSQIKTALLDAFRFQEAEAVQAYIDHCVVTSRLVKKVLNS